MYTPGESPFHVRGSTYLHVREYAVGTVPGGMEAVAAALPGAHRDFVVQAFTADDWYDALPLRPLTERMATLEGRSWEESVRARAEAKARRDYGGLGGRLRRVGNSPDKVLEKFQHTALGAFNFGQAELVPPEGSRVRLVFHEIPQPLGSWFLAMMRGYAVVMLDSAGGRDPKIGGRLIPKGRRANLGLVDVRMDLDWT